MSKLVDKYGYDLNKVIDHQKEIGAEAVVNVCLKAQEVELELIQAQSNNADVTNSPKLFWLRRFWARLIETANSATDLNKDGFIKEDEIANLDAEYLDGTNTPVIPIGE